MRKANKRTPQHPTQNRRSQKSGLPPGSLIYIGPEHSHQPYISAIQYNAEVYDELDINEQKPIDSIREQPDVTTWINLNGVHNTRLVHTIGKHYHLDALILEDICNTDQRPKVEIHEDYLFMTLRILSINKSNNQLESEQLSAVLGRQFLVSFQEENNDTFLPLKERLQQSKGKIRQRGHDYLMYCLLDTVVDNYFLIIEYISQQTDDLEDLVYASPDQTHMADIQENKKLLLLLRRQIYPLREAISNLLKNNTEFIESQNEKYFRDVYDHLFHMVESIENLLEMNTGLKDLHLSSINLKMNQVIQILTIFTAIFTPLTFIVGLYGMNFDNMPELHWKYGYFAVLGVMGTIVLGLLIFLKLKKWLR